MAAAYILEHHCPMPCGTVVFARCRDTGRAFAVCTACGCAWFDPARETWEMGDTGNAVTNYYEYAPRGFVLAEWDDLVRAGFERLVFAAAIGDYGQELADDFDWFDRTYYVERGRPDHAGW